MTSEADKLIYENSNTYRIHADNLRWTLLGGYVIFLAAIVGLSQPSTASMAINDPAISLLAFLLSFAYLWILAVQNWFYNLFARWVDDCEYRLINCISLQSLQTFAKAEGNTVSPFHPAFFLAEILVGSIAYYFLTLTVMNSTITSFTPILQALPNWVASLFWILGLVLYFTSLNVLFLKWDKLVYKPIIRRLSNIYKPVHVENHKDTHQNSI